MPKNVLLLKKNRKIAVRWEIRPQISNFWR